MKSKILNNNGQKTFALILDRGDETSQCILDFAKEQGLSAAHFSAIGAFRHATLGFFDLEIRDYRKIVIDEQAEVLHLGGDITLYNGEPKLHAHVVLGKRDGTAHGGHLIEATVDPTLEIILTESPAYLKRQMDEATGLPLIEV